MKFDVALLVVTFCAFTFLSGCEKSDFDDNTADDIVIPDTDSEIIPVDTAYVDTSKSEPGTDTSTVAPIDPYSKFFSVTNLLDMYKTYGKDFIMAYTNVRVEAYIVGVVDGNSITRADFEPPFTRPSNILIANDTSVKDVKQCMPAQLPNGSYVRDELNLVENPGNYKRKVHLYGSLDIYFRVCGIRPVYDFEWVED